MQGRVYINTERWICLVEDEGRRRKIRFVHELEPLMRVPAHHGRHEYEDDQHQNRAVAPWGNIKTSFSSVGARLRLLLPPEAEGWVNSH